MSQGKVKKSVPPPEPVPPDELPPLLKIKQVVQLTGIPERTYWRWSRCGLAPTPVKIGTGVKPAVRYSRDDILEWMAAGCPKWEA